MGLDPATLALIGTLGSSVIGGLTAPGAQELFSFEGETFGEGGPSLDPRSLLGGALSGVARLGGRLTEMAEQPIQLQTRAQDVPFFFGGDLPFPIGLTASDPGAPLIPGKTLDDPFGAGGFRNFDGGGGAGQPEFPLQPDDPFPDRPDPFGIHGDQPGGTGGRPVISPDVVVPGGIDTGGRPDGGDPVPTNVFQALLAQGGGGDFNDLLTALNVISVTQSPQLQA